MQLFRNGDRKTAIYTDRVRKAETQKARKTDLVGKIKHRKDPCIETQRNRETRQKQTKMEKEMGNK